MAQITEDYVSFETARFLKEKGFDSEEVGCHGGFYSERYYQRGYGVKTQSGQEVGIVYDDLTNSDLDYDEYLRPTLQMAMKWLRETHKIVIEISAIYGSNEDYSYTYVIRNKEHCLFRKFFETYEDACETAIKYCLENLV